jgi:hypothetical protein
MSISWFCKATDAAEQDCSYEHVQFYSFLVEFFSSSGLWQYFTCYWQCASDAADEQRTILSSSPGKLTRA